MPYPETDSTGDWQRLLVCPYCRGDFGTGSAGALRCTRCTRMWPQSDPRVVDLISISDPYPDPAHVAWTRRQRIMIGQYDKLAADPDHARLAFRNDFGPLRPVLETLRGIVVDVGGGQGLAREWLPDPQHYIVVDPEIAWLEQPWHLLSDTFPSLERELFFVRGLAEQLPFSNHSVDVVLSIFGLNHVIEPRKAVGEMTRILRPGGRLVLVLEDIRLRWRDLGPGGTYAVKDAAEHRLLRWRSLLTLCFGQPIAPDHLRVSERELARWTHGMETIERNWRGVYLCMVYRKP